MANRLQTCLSDIVPLFSSVAASAAALLAPCGYNESASEWISECPLPSGPFCYISLFIAALNQPLLLPMDIQETRKIRRVELLQEEQGQPGRHAEERSHTWTASRQREAPAEKSASSAGESVQGKGRGGKRGHTEQEDGKEQGGKRRVSMSTDSKEGKQRNRP